MSLPLLAAKVNECMQALVESGSALRGDVLRAVAALALLRFLHEYEALCPGQGMPGAQKIAAEVARDLPARGLSAVRDALQRIEDMNSSLAGLGSMLGPHLWGGDAEEKMIRLLSFSPLPSLSPAELRGAVLGEWFEDFLLQNISYRDEIAPTPRWLSRFMADLLQPRVGMSICDPALGYGTMLTALMRRSMEDNMMPDGRLVHGQEINLQTRLMGQINLIFHNTFNARIELGDTLREPRLVTASSLIQYDRVVSDLPWGRTGWRSVEEMKHWRDPFDRFDPPSSASSVEYAYIQHCIATLKPTGLGAVTVPRTILNREGVAAEVRERVVRAGHVKAVVCFSNAGRSTRPPYNTFAVLLLRGALDWMESSDIILVDMNFRDLADPIDPSYREKLERVAAFVSGVGNERPERTQIVSVEDVARARWSLLPSLYLDAETVQSPSASEVGRMLVDAEARRDGLAHEIDTLTAQLLRRQSRPPSA